MIDHRQIALRIYSTKQRCHFLKKEIGRQIDGTQYASPLGAHALLKFIDLNCDRISDRLTSLEGRVSPSPSSEAPTSSEIEIKVQQSCSLFSYLCELLAFVDGSDIQAVPPQIVQPIRRFVRKLFPQAEIIIVSSSAFNYSVFDIIPSIRQLAGENGADNLLTIPETLPSHLFLISIPRTDRQNVLLHSILSHEIGHPIYEIAGIAQRINPIDIDAEYLQLVQRYIEDQRRSLNLAADANLGDQLWLQSNLTLAVNEVISNWKKELVSDAIGIYIFGPAFLFAMILFSSAMDFLDRGGKTHPPFRLRLKLIFKIIDVQYPPDSFTGKIKEMMDHWRVLSNSSLSSSNPILFGALKSMNKDEILADIITKSREGIASIARDVIYSVDDFRKADQHYKRLFIHGILPISENDRPGEPPSPTNAVSIFNAGWIVYLNSFDEFARLLPASIQSNDNLSFEKLNEVIAKTLELHELNLRNYEAR